MKAEETWSAAARTHSHSHSGSMHRDPRTATDADKAHVRALLDRTQSATRPQPTTTTTTSRELEPARPRWRSTAADALYEPKREPVDATFNGYNATAYERSSFFHHPYASPHASGDLCYEAEHAHPQRTYEAAPQPHGWGSEQAFAYSAEPYAQLLPHVVLPRRRAADDHYETPLLSAPPPPRAPSHHHSHHQPLDDYSQYPSHEDTPYYHPTRLYAPDPEQRRHEHQTHTSRYHVRDDDDDLDDSGGRVVVHLQEPLDRQLPVAHKATSRQDVTSLRSTSNSSVASFDSDNDDNDTDDTNDVHGASLGRHDPLDDLTLDMYEDNELHSDFLHVVHMLIPSNAFGCLVGSHGAIIRYLNARTGCTLSIRDGAAFALPTDGDSAVDAHRVLRIYGAPKAICLAQHLVIDRIRAHRKKKLDPLYTPLTLRGHNDVLVPLATDAVSKALSDALASRQPKRTAASKQEEPSVAFGPIKWLLPSANVGKIMGSDGLIMRTIARASNTKIHVTPTVDMPRGSTERLVTISGPPSANFELARAEIARLAGGRFEAQAVESRDSQYFAIPFHTVGALIGPQGAIANTIKAQTGVRLQIPHSEHLPLGSVNGIVHLQGTRQQVEHAYTVVRTRIRRELERLAIENNVDADDNDTNDEPPLPPITHVALKILLPIRIVNLMLEQQGRLVHEVAAKSGAHTHFLPSHGDELRLCLISGTLVPVMRAERLILQLVAGDLIATKRSTGDHGFSGVLPRQKRKRDATDDKDDAMDRGSDRRAGRAPAVAVAVGVRRGGRLNERNDERRSGGASHDTRRLQPSSAKQPHSGRAAPQRLVPRAPDEKRDVIDRLQGPLQAARSTGSGGNKRQRY